MTHKKKNKKKVAKDSKGLAKIATLTTRSISSAFSKYKKNKEIEKIREIKMQKLEIKNQVLKDYCKYISKSQSKILKFQHSFSNYFVVKRLKGLRLLLLNPTA